MQDDILKRVLRFLSGKFPDLAAELDAEIDLRKTALLDSLAIMEIVVFLEQDFGLNVERSDLDHFETPRTIADLIHQKQTG